MKRHVATRLCIWATQRLREYMVKEFVLDDERLKNPDQPFDYFDELLRRIQDRRVANKLDVRYNTVSSQCTRGIGLNTEEFINKVGSKAIVEWLETKYPDQYHFIKSELRKRPS